MQSAAHARQPNGVRPQITPGIRDCALSGRTAGEKPEHQRKPLAAAQPLDILVQQIRARSTPKHQQRLQGLRWVAASHAIHPDENEEKRPAAACEDFGGNATERLTRCPGRSAVKGLRRGE